METVKTKLHPNTPNSPSLRTTVPEGIVEFLGVKTGGTLNWKMEVINNKRVAIVEKVEN